MCDKCNINITIYITTIFEITQNTMHFVGEVGFEKNDDNTGYFKQSSKEENKGILIKNLGSLFQKLSLNKSENFEVSVVRSLS